MKALDEFLDQLRLDAPECGLPLLRQALRDSARTFCKRTNIWQKEVTRSLQNGKREYIVPLEENSILIEVIQMSRRIENTNPIKYADRTRYKQTQQDLDFTHDAWRDTVDNNAGFIHWGITPDRKRVFLQQKPGIDYQDGIRYTFTMAPDNTASEVIDILVDEYVEEIAAGAAAKILVMPRQVWTDPALAGLRKSEFNRGVSSCLRKTLSSVKRAKFRKLGS